MRTQGAQIEIKVKLPGTEQEGGFSRHWNDVIQIYVK